ncbi:MAG: hypothetical protein HC810_03500 [Acaryochloridaceae cyanobacterium RL_2_7]|nr:hypothetical protein [Acaryochloridaceae cyanobacterium RL_2_7]
MERHNRWDSDGLPPPQKTSCSGQEWVQLQLQEEDNTHWIQEVSPPPFYHRLLLILGGLAIVSPLSWWGSVTLQNASQTRDVVAATPIQPTPVSHPLGPRLRKICGKSTAKY